MAETPVTSDVQPPIIPARDSHMQHLNSNSSCHSNLQPPDMSELRVVLLGNSCSDRREVGNFILGETVFNTEEESTTVRGLFKDKEIVLINTEDLLLPNISEHKLKEYVEKSLCSWASCVLQPEDFTEQHKLRLCRVLQLFCDRSFDHSLVLISTPKKKGSGFMERYRQHPPLKDMISMCRYRFLWRKNLEHPELLTRMEQIVKENNRGHVTCKVNDFSSICLKQEETTSAVTDTVKVNGE